MPERSRLILETKRQLPDLVVVFDKGWRNAMTTFCLALEEAGGGPMVLMEDDAILCPDFPARIAAVISERPDVPIQFFSRMSEDIERKSRWMGGATYRYNICAYLPAGMAAAVRKFRETWPHIEKHPTGTDYLIADYMRAHKMRYWLHVPSLVQHAEAPSAIGGRPMNRQSKTFDAAWGKRR